MLDGPDTTVIPTIDSSDAALAVAAAVAMAPAGAYEVTDGSGRTQGGLSDTARARVRTQDATALRSALGQWPPSWFYALRPFHRVLRGSWLGTPFSRSCRTLRGTGPGPKSRLGLRQGHTRWYGYRRQSRVRGCDSLWDRCRGERQADREGGTSGWQGGQLNVSSVGGDEILDEGEAQPGAAARSGTVVVEADESVPDSIPVADWDTGTVVGHGYSHTIFFDDTDLDVAVGVTQGVVHEVGDDAAELQGISPTTAWSSRPGKEIGVAGRGLRMQSATTPYRSIGGGVLGVPRRGEPVREGRSPGARADDAPRPTPRSRFADRRSRDDAVRPRGRPGSQQSECVVRVRRRRRNGAGALPSRTSLRAWRSGSSPDGRVHPRRRRGPADPDLRLR